MGIGGRINGVGVGDGAAGSSGGVTGSADVEDNGRADDGREPMVVELDSLALELVPTKKIALEMW